MNNFIPVTVAYGDRTGPEAMDSVLYILKEASVPLRIEIIEIGEKLYNKCYKYGISESGWEQLQRTKALLKSSIAIPQYAEYQNFNIAIRRFFNLYVNIDRIASYLPQMISYPSLNTDIVIIYGNEEDICSAKEYRHTTSIWETSRLISYNENEKRIIFAFEYALKHGYKQVTCVTKNDIANSADSIFYTIFESIAERYSGTITANYYDADHCSMSLTIAPEKFGVIITPSIYGNILRSITTAATGLASVTANASIGTEYAMFEPMYNSSQGITDTSILGLLNASIMMLKYLSLDKHAKNIEQAVIRTLADGIHTADIYNEKLSKQKVGTREFSQAIKERLNLSVVRRAIFNPNINNQHNIYFNTDRNFSNNNIAKELVGVDIFCDSNIIINHSQMLEYILSKSSILGNIYSMQLSEILARGIKIWPEYRAINQIFSDYWCLRFYKQVNSKPDKIKNPKYSKQIQHITTNNIINLLRDVTLILSNNVEHTNINTHEENRDDFRDQKSQYSQIIQIEIVKTQNLYMYNNKPGFS